MFFITPQRRQPPNKTTNGAQSATEESCSKRKRVEPVETTTQHDQSHGYYPKRVSRACDRCRLKKTRCSGTKVCDRCRRDGVVCVVTSAPKKNDLAQHPRYVQLVESQRDQLARALQQLLQNDNSMDSSKVKGLLAEMGIAAENLRVDEETSPDASTDPNETVRISWDKVFDNLTEPQLRSMESFCMNSPRIQTEFDSFDNYMSFDSALNNFTSPTTIGGGSDFENAQPQGQHNQYLESQGYG